jgi:hypothetical protein
MTDGWTTAIDSGALRAHQLTPEARRGLCGTALSMATAFDGVQDFRLELWHANPGPTVARSRDLLIPLWWLIVPPLFMTAAAWRLDLLAGRRARLNLCPTCHYDRTGLAPGAACPECGAGASPTPL